MRIFVHDYAGHPFALELSRELARRGHVVRHAYFAADTGPKGQIQPLPDDPEGFSIQPIAIRQSYSKADLVRRHLLDGAYGVAAGAAITAFRPDVVLAANTPLNALGGLQRAARRIDARFVFWLQDVFGLAAEALLARRWGGAGRLVAAYYQAMERNVARRSDHIIAISDAFVPYLRALGVRDNAISVLQNWGPLSLVSPQPKDNSWAAEHGLRGKLVFTYTGTLGLKHNPRLLHDLAQSFQDREDVVIQVAAAGVGAEWLKTQPRLPQLQLLPLAPAERLAEVYGAADVLTALLEEAAGAFSAPSKVLTYLCAARPILLSASPENVASKVVEEAGAGLSTPASDADAFVAAARQLADSPARRAACGAAGRAYAERTFDIKAIGGRFEAALGARAGLG